MYARIALPLPLDKTFTYAIPPDLRDGIIVGNRVRVSFGKARSVGVVVGIEKESPVAEVKEILGFLDQEPLVSQEMLELTRWAAQECCVSWGEVLALAVPGFIGKGIRKETAARRKGQLTCELPPSLTILRKRLWQPFGRLSRRKGMRFSCFTGLRGAERLKFTWVPLRM